MSKPHGRLKLSPPSAPGDRMGALRTAAAPLESRAEYAAEIARLWTQAQQHFLAIGRYLLHARERIGEGEWEAMVREDLPFGRAVAHQLRSVAAMVEDGALPVAQMPRSYATAYQIATLTPDERARAAGEGLLRPDVTRPEILGFKRRVRGNPPLAVTDELRRLEAERDRLEARIAELRRQLGEEPS